MKLADMPGTLGYIRREAKMNRITLLIAHKKQLSLSSYLSLRV
mgnify:CR=1 FL=1